MSLQRLPEAQSSTHPNPHGIVVCNPDVQHYKIMVSMILVDHMTGNQ